MDRASGMLGCNICIQFHSFSSGTGRREGGEACVRLLETCETKVGWGLGGTSMCRFVLAANSFYTVTRKRYMKTKANLLAFPRARTLGTWFCTAHCPETFSGLRCQRVILVPSWFLRDCSQNHRPTTTTTTLSISLPFKHIHSFHVQLSGRA